jgi:hypothetical protein
MRKARTSDLQESLLSAALSAGGSCPNATARLRYYSAMDTSKKAQIVSVTMAKKTLVARGLLKADRNNIVLTVAGKKLAESLIKTPELKISPEPSRPVNGNGAVHQARAERQIADCAPSHRRAHRTAGSRRRVRIAWPGFEWVMSDYGEDEAPPQASTG